ncbi:hypothetical protein KIN20_030038 [Parelaphostrongylus tenuis]|uniref:Uncharacterized protein n=1 Tax=Parelaphostrongylus tenuis TaxID=148309 RepID=A0AAD5R3L5_PARTN|nr:hypothetical protein KIN20_030038 [Parelaphostrongylus tenuis]
MVLNVNNIPVARTQSSQSHEHSDVLDRLRNANPNNVWSGNHYTQMRGLAMGQRLAASLAIAFTPKVEAPVLDLRPLLYCRTLNEYFYKHGKASDQSLCDFSGSHNFDSVWMWSDACSLKKH